MTEWHSLGPADDFRDGAAHAVHAFGAHLVAFADRAGVVHVLDARCPHMGGDLSRGRVVGDTIDCPIHLWRWNGSGRCVGGSPKLIPVRAWVTEERDGVVFVQSQAPVAAPVAGLVTGPATGPATAPARG